MDIKSIFWELKIEELKYGLIWFAIFAAVMGIAWLIDHRR